MADEIKKFSKEWHLKNPEYNREKRREFIQRNPDYDKQKVKCEICGVSYSRSNKSHHKKTIAHLRYLQEQLNEIEFKKE